MATLASLETRVKRLRPKLFRPPPWECPGPVELARAAGIILDDWQQEMVCSTAARVSACCSRQVGKSTSAAVLAVWTALHADKQLVLIVAPSLRQSAENMRSVIGLWRALGRPIRAVSESVLSLSLANGSRVIALPGTEETIRGFSNVACLILDEAARIPDSLFIAVLPFLSTSNGQLVTLSSPAGARGWWYEAWKSSEPWERYMIKAEQCKRISSAFLQEMQNTMGAYFYNQEFCCVFNDPVTAAFPGWAIDTIIKPGEIEAWDI